METKQKRRGRGIAYQYYNYILKEYNEERELVNTKRYVCSTDVIKDYPCIKNRKQLARIYHIPRQDRINSHLVVKQIKEPVFQRIKVIYD